MLSLFDFVKLFFTARYDHPGRRSTPVRRTGRHGSTVSGNSKWHRRMVAAGLKPNESPYYPGPPNNGRVFPPKPGQSKDLINCDLGDLPLALFDAA